MMSLLQQKSSPQVNESHWPADSTLQGYREETITRVRRERTRQLFTQPVPSLSISVHMCVADSTTKKTGKGAGRAD